MSPLLKALDISLAALLSFFTQVEQGFRQMEQGEYAKAAEVLTHVIGSEYAKTPVEEFARLSRAEAYINLKIPREAQPDLAYLIQHSDNDEIVKQARVLFELVEGNLADFLPRESAAATAQQALDAWAEKRFEVLPAFFSGEIAAAFNVYKTLYGEQLEGKSIYGAWADQLQDARLISVRTNALEQVEVVVQGEGLFTLQMEVVAASWKFTELKGYTEEVEKYHARQMRQFEPVRHANIKRLKRLGTAVLLYHQENRSYPPEYESLVEYLNVKLSILAWTHPDTGKTNPFLFRDALVTPSAPVIMVMAAPMAYRGQREVLFVDGRVEVLPEADFVARLKAQQWFIPELVANELAAPEKADEINGLIERLIRGDFKQRRSAKKQLQEMGVVTYPYLLKYKSSPDPEVRMTIEELLKPR